MNIATRLPELVLGLAAVLGQAPPPPPGGAGGAPPGGPAPALPPPAKPAGSFIEELFGGRYSMMWLLLAMFLVFYFLVIRPESRRQKARNTMLKAMKKGDWVITSAGLIGRVHRLDEKEVLLQVDKESNVKIRFLKSSITEVLPNGGKGQEEGAKEPSKEAMK
ncbi:MAG: preprotein translocase subunit YajC [Planctomycetes bacterium]|nr:preprotein translocase subunit YajC [Planctomycetota bacterium]